MALFLHCGLRSFFLDHGYFLSGVPYITKCPLGLDTTIIYLETHICIFLIWDAVCRDTKDISSRLQIRLGQNDYAALCIYIYIHIYRMMASH